MQEVFTSLSISGIAMKSSTAPTRLSSQDFKQQVLLRLQQLEARQEAQRYAPVLVVIRQQMSMLLDTPPRVS